MYNQLKLNTMTLPEYVHNHLIDLDLMSKSELSDLLDTIYNHSRITCPRQEPTQQDFDLYSLLVTVETLYDNN